MRFDRTISLGTILHALVLVVAIGAAWADLSSRIAVLTVKVDVLWSRAGIEPRRAPIYGPRPSSAEERTR